MRVPSVVLLKASDHAVVLDLPNTDTIAANLELRVLICFRPEVCSLWQSCRLSCALPDIQRCICFNKLPVDAVHASRLSTINGLDISIDLLRSSTACLIQLHLEGKRQAQTWFLCVLASCLLPAKNHATSVIAQRSHDLLQILLMISACSNASDIVLYSPPQKTAEPSKYQGLNLDSSPSFTRCTPVECGQPAANTWLY